MKGRTPDAAHEKGPQRRAPGSLLCVYDLRLTTSYRAESVLFRVAFDELLVPHIG